MNRYPENIELLIQELCESRDSKAILEFESRFPEYKTLLHEHLSMGELMATTRPSAPVALPRFFPPVRPAWHSWVGRGLVAASVVGVGYAAFLFGINSGAAKATTEPSATMSTAPVTQENTESTPLQVEPAPAVPPKPHDDDVKAPQDMVARIERIVSVDVADAPLTEVFRQIESQTGLKISVAPGFGDSIVTVHQSGVPAAALLEQLGQQYQFTAMPQGTEEVLIIPARDGSPGRLSNPDIDVRGPEDR